MEFSDKRWTGLIGGYRVPFDPRPTLQELLVVPGSSQLWTNLWDELHHQGDVDTAAYASIPVIAEIAEQDVGGDWNAYAFASTVEEARHAPNNPPLPDWLSADYYDGWTSLFKSALRLLEYTTSEPAIASALSVVAHHRGQRSLARMALLTEDERVEMLDQVGWG